MSTSSADITALSRLELASVAQRREYRYVKRLLDFCLSLVALLLLSPFMAVIAVLVKLTSSGPVFYKWRVIGQGGEPFVGFKFRTMVENAESMEKEFRASGRNEMQGVYFKLKDDPRLTPLGVYLRKYSLDELPTLLSVLVGKMSLVGPRPIRVHEYEELNDWHKMRLLVKPGVTGLWQVCGKNKISDFDEIVKIDLLYIDKWSLWFDIKILFKTIPVVLFGKNF
jgi:lipopolysaccharide/colanic/teichoic acid biosynthesis glycosyltransferase